jgi:hypothetical protein
MREGLLRMMRFPRLVIPLSVLLTTDANALYRPTPFATIPTVTQRHPRRQRRGHPLGRTGAIR